MSEITQKEVNDAFDIIKAEWDLMVSASGKSEQMFVITGNGASALLYEHQKLKEHLENLGLIMPVLVEGLTITETD